MTHLSVSEERRNGVSQRGKYREELLRSQQGELERVPCLYTKGFETQENDGSNHAYTLLPVRQEAPL